MNTMTTILLGISLLFASAVNMKQDEKIAQLSERIQTLEAKK
jgi:hypothetical protein